MSIRKLALIGNGYEESEVPTTSTTSSDYVAILSTII